jgi:hypothetical protein
MNLGFGAQLKAETRARICFFLAEARRDEALLQGFRLQASSGRDQERRTRWCLRRRCAGSAAPRSIQEGG